jgi:hypothetical protein
MDQIQYGAGEDIVEKQGHRITGNALMQGHIHTEIQG